VGAEGSGRSTVRNVNFIKFISVSLSKEMFYINELRHASSSGSSSGAKFKSWFVEVYF
jgi:hypothetical protein